MEGPGLRGVRKGGRRGGTGSGGAGDGDTPTGLLDRAAHQLQADVACGGRLIGVEPDAVVGHGEDDSTLGNAQLSAQRMIDARHLVLHDLARRVPDAKLLAQFGVEGFEEGFVEILDRVPRLELLEEASLSIRFKASAAQSSTVVRSSAFSLVGCESCSNKAEIIGTFRSSAAVFQSNLPVAPLW